MSRMGLPTGNTCYGGRLFKAACMGFLILLALAADVTFGEVTVYPRPGPSIKQSDLYRVSVIQGGKTYESFVYQIHSPKAWPFRHNVCSFTMFSFCEPITVEVTRLSGPSVSSCRVYPSSYEITPEIMANNKVRFTLTQPLKKMAVIFDQKDWMTHPLLIFADPLETNVPQPGDANVIYFGPGVHDVGEFHATAGQTVYIAGGAYVIGNISAENQPEVTVRGRGILSQEGYSPYDAHRADRESDWPCSIDFDGLNTTDCLIEGITIIHPSSGTRSGNSGSVVRNVKQVGAWPDSTGAGMNGFSVPMNGIVEDCFIEASDDAVPTRENNTVVRRNVFWLAGHGSMCQFGWNVGEEHHNFHTYDQDIIYAKICDDYDWWNPGIIWAVYGQHGYVHDHLIENIRLENCDYRLLSLRIIRMGYTDWTRGLGHISDVKIRNVTVTDGMLRPGMIHGGDAEHRISDLTVENLVVNGSPVTDPEGAKIDVDPATTSNVRFVISPQVEPWAHYTLEGNARDRQGRFHGTIQGASFVQGIAGARGAHFDGIDDRIEIPCSVRDNFTLACWVRTSQEETGWSRWYEGCGLIDGNLGQTTSDFGVSVLFGKFAFGVGNPDKTLKATTSINDGRWHHVAATRDGTTGTMQVFVDGRCEAAGTGPTGERAATPSLFIGAIRTGFPCFEGDIDDVRIYNRVLDANEVTGLQDVTPPQPSPSEFAVPPTAVSSAAVTMEAVAGTDDRGGAVEYRFEEMTAKSGVHISDWQTDPKYTDSGLDQDTTYLYTVTLRDARGNETATSAAAAVHTLKAPAANVLVAPWRQQDIGTHTSRGRVFHENGVFTIYGSGSGGWSQTWTTGDEFYFVHQATSGDCQIIARVAKQSFRNPWSKAGVMIRDSLAPSSAFAMMAITPGHGATFEWRSAQGSAARAYVNEAAENAPIWLQLTRRGSTLAGYVSPDGKGWTQVGTSQTISMAARTGAVVGLCVANPVDGQFSKAVFDEVSVSGNVAEPLGPQDATAPQPNRAWFNLPPSATGSTSIKMEAVRGYDDSRGTVEYRFEELTGHSGGSSSPWQTDFRYSENDLRPDTEYTYRVTMRDTAGNMTQPSDPVTVRTPPAVALPSPWQQGDIGGVSAHGTASYVSSVFSIYGSGGGTNTGIWGQADEFYFVYQTAVGNREIIARVASQSPANPWAKTGVMFRNTTDVSSPFAMIVVTPGYGVSFQWRTMQGTATQAFTTDPSDETDPSRLSPARKMAPIWLKLTRAGNSFTGYLSNDGTTWTRVGESQSIPMRTDVAAGLCVTSCSDGIFVSAVVDHVALQNLNNMPGVLDTTPPQPNPAQFAVVPTAVNGRTITMEAVPGTDASGVVEYRFDEVSGAPGGTSSAWQSDPKYTVTDLQPNVSYAYTVTLRDAVGNQTQPSQPVFVRTPNGPLRNVLPSPWKQQDVGGVSAHGYVFYESGVFTAYGSGGGASGGSQGETWAAEDEFYFVHQTAGGDCEIVARVLSQTETDRWAKAGVMIRSSLDRGSPFAMVAVTPYSGVSL